MGERVPVSTKVMPGEERAQERMNRKYSGRLGGISFDSLVKESLSGPSDVHGQRNNAC